MDKYTKLLISDCIMEMQDRLQNIYDNRDIFYANDNSYPINTKERPVEDTNYEYINKMSQNKLGNKIRWREARRLGEDIIKKISLNVKNGMDNVDVTPQYNSSPILARIYSKTINKLLEGFNVKYFADRVTRNSVVDGFTLISGDIIVDRVDKKYAIEKDTYSELKKQNVTEYKPIKEGNNYFVEKEELNDISINMKTHKIDEVVFDIYNEKWEDKEFIILIDEMTKSIYRKKFKNAKFDDEYSTIRVFSVYVKNKKSSYDVSYYSTHNPYDNANEIDIDMVFDKPIKTEKNVTKFFYGINGLAGEDDIFGDGISEFVGDIQNVQESIINGALDNIWRANQNITFYKKGALTPTGKIALEAGSSFVEVNPRNAALRDVVYTPQFNAIPASVLQMINFLDNKNDSNIDTGANVPAYANKDNYQTALTYAMLNIDSITNNIKIALEKFFEFMVENILIKLTEDDFVYLINTNIESESLKEAKILVTELLNKIPEEQLTEDVVNDAIESTTDEIYNQIAKYNNKYDMSINIASSQDSIAKSQRILSLLNVLAQLNVELDSESIVEISKELMYLTGLDYLSGKLSVKQADPYMQQKMKAESEEAMAKAEKDKALAENSRARTKKILSQIPNDVNRGIMDNTQKELAIRTQAQDILGNLNSEQQGGENVQ